ncbi:MAG: aldo/keto reductase [Deltaproteobacteria bacterium]|nr:aldo/keto reductase [Deltaproteobacteria bacterium]MBW2413730.1 aldo/keto reductase [Deltaproteobacteria bacterium]
MEFVKLGGTGLEVSRLCLGTMTYGSPDWRPWVLDEEASRPMIRRALEAGINFFDTADIYSLGESERILGRTLNKYAKRDEVVIATKLYFPMRDSGSNRTGLSRKRIFDCIDASLERLGTDYVDLYQVHRFDSGTPVEETLEALTDVVRSGRARYIGASSMYAWQFARALYRADMRGFSRFVSMQNHYNLVFRDEEREMLPLCRAENVGVIPYSPLSRGFLAGSRARESWETTLRARTDRLARREQYRDCDFSVLDRLVSLAKRRRVTPAQVAVAWLLSKPEVTAPVIGVSGLPQLEEAIASVGIQLEDAEVSQLERDYQPRAERGFL